MSEIYQFYDSAQDEKYAEGVQITKQNLDSQVDPGIRQAVDMPLNYIIEFAIYPIAAAPNGVYTSIFQITDNGTDMGSDTGNPRNPGIWFEPGTSKLCVILSPKKGSQTVLVEPSADLSLNTWYDISVKVNGSTITLDINEDESGYTFTKSVEIVTAEKRIAAPNSVFYCSSPWYSPANAKIKDIAIIKLPDAVKTRSDDPTYYPPFPNDISNEQMDEIKYQDSLFWKNRDEMTSLKSKLGDIQSVSFGDLQNYQSSLDGLVQAINERMTELTLYQNIASTNNNVNQEILYKQEQLTRLENDQLTDQLRELENIQNMISNKERILMESNMYMKKNQENIYALSWSVIIALLIFGAVGAYGAGKIDGTKLGGAISLIIFIYFFILGFIYNWFYMRDALYILRQRREKILNERIQKWGISDAQERMRTRIYGPEDQWIEDNCTKPCGATEEESYALYAQETTKPVKGHFYNDGSSPAQLLVPKPTKDTTIFEDGIDWVDYSKNSNLYYEQNKKKIRMNQPGVFKGNFTYTADL